MAQLREKKVIRFYGDIKEDLLEMLSVRTVSKHKNDMKELVLATILLIGLTSAVETTTPQQELNNTKEENSINKRYVLTIPQYNPFFYANNQVLPTQLLTIGNEPSFTNYINSFQFQNSPYDNIPRYYILPQNNFIPQYGFQKIVPQIQNNVASKAPQAQIIPQQLIPQQKVIPQQVLQRIVPQQTLPQGAIPQQILSQRVVPQQALPQQVLSQRINPPQGVIPQQILPPQRVTPQQIIQQVVPQKVIPQQVAPQQIIPQQVLQQQVVPQRIIPQQVVPQQILSQQTVPQLLQQQVVPQRIIPQQVVPQQIVPQQLLQQQVVPQRIIQQQVVPQQLVPQRVLPQQILPQQVVPQQIVPQLRPQQVVPQQVLPQKVIQRVQGNRPTFPTQQIISPLQNVHPVLAQQQVPLYAPLHQHFYHPQPPRQQVLLRNEPYPYELPPGQQKLPVTSEKQTPVYPGVAQQVSQLYPTGRVQNLLYNVPFPSTSAYSPLSYLQSQVNAQPHTVYVDPNLQASSGEPQQVVRIGYGHPHYHSGEIVQNTQPSTVYLNPSLYTSYEGNQQVVRIGYVQPSLNREIVHVQNDNGPQKVRLGIPYTAQQNDVGGYQYGSNDRLTRTVTDKDELKSKETETTEK